VLGGSCTRIAGTVPGVVLSLPQMLGGASARMCTEALIRGMVRRMSRHQEWQLPVTMRDSKNAAEAKVDPKALGSRLFQPVCAPRGGGCDLYIVIVPQNFMTCDASSNVRCSRGKSHTWNRLSYTKNSTNVLNAIRSDAARFHSARLPARPYVARNECPRSALRAFRSDVQYNPQQHDLNTPGSRRQWKGQ
jgi:hypothetical protein